MRLFCVWDVKDVLRCVLQEAPWCCPASAASSFGSAPVSPWWSSCSVSTMASVSLLGTPWMWSPLSCTQQTGGEYCTHYIQNFSISTLLIRAHLTHTTKCLTAILVFLFSGAQALASVTQCVNWQRCWATWSLAHWWASLRPFPFCWHRLCWLAVGWWGSDCQTHVPMSSCKPQRRTVCNLPGVHSISWITNHLWTRICLNITEVNCLLSPPSPSIFIIC